MYPNFERLAKLLEGSKGLPCSSDTIRRYTIFREGEETKFKATDSWIKRQLWEIALQFKSLYPFGRFERVWVIELPKNYREMIEQKKAEVDG